LVSRNRRGLCGDASHAKDIIENALETSEGTEGGSAPFDLNEISESQSTAKPSELWGRWAVELYTFNRRCKAGIDERALTAIVERKHGFLEGGLLASALKEPDCDVVIAVEQMEAWPFPFDLADQLVAGKFHAAEVTRQLWIQSLSQSLSSCAETLNDKDKTSIRVHQSRLEGLVRLDDEMLIDLRKRLSTAISAGRVEEASALAVAVSEREVALDTREANAQMQAAKLREAKANAERAAAQRAAAQHELTKATEKSAREKEKDESNNWITDILQGIGEGVARAATCKVQGTCGHF
jgi:hypothetical protein